MIAQKDVILRQTVKLEWKANGNRALEFTCKCSQSNNLKEANSPVGLSINNNLRHKPSNFEQQIPNPYG